MELLLIIVKQFLKQSKEFVFSENLKKAIIII